MIIAKSLVKPQVLNVRFGLKRDDCPMIPRDMKQKLLQLATKFPVVSVTGPRQSGKSTLIKNAFPAYTYFSFEDPATRELFQADPKGFLRLHNHHAIFDEAQRVPELFSYLQGRDVFGARCAPRARRDEDGGVLALHPALCPAIW